MIDLPVTGIMLGSELRNFQKNKAKGIRFKDFMIKHFLFLTIITATWAQLCIASDFRDAEWGMPRERVEKLEKTEPIYSKTDVLTFKGKIANNRVNILYEFSENKLITGTYQFIDNHPNGNVYIQDYEKMNEFLDTKYGKPTYRKEIWNNDIYKDKKGFWGAAVSTGQLMLESSWREDRTIITHKLSGKNYIIDHSIYYYDKLSTKKQAEKNDNEEIKGL